MAIDFDKVIDRSDNYSAKWEEIEENFGSADALPFWVADMDFKSPEPVIEALEERAKQGIYGYTIRPESYNQAIIDWFNKRHDWNIKADWINYSPGIVPALSFLIRSLANRGDKVLIQPPVYYPFYNVIEKNGCHVTKNSLSLEDGHYEIDFDDFEEKAKDPRVKIFILCSPHNPVGRVWTEEELERIGNICLENNITVISDEIHCDLVYSGNQHTPFASISEDFAQNSITCIAPSKTFNLAGLQASSIVIPNEEIRKEFTNMIETFDLKRNNAFSAVAVETAYTEGEEWLDSLLEYLEDNLTFLEDFFKKEIPEVEVIHPEGTYLVWLDFRELGMTPEELEDFMIEEANVALDHGNWFGPEGNGFERINIACPRSLLKDGLERIRDAVKKL
ncbi:MalY/PatB family protein [Sporohalobacter salinus]|uniref:MalY/PatB family protein n=1 Tax=Sporohalobacter salinus TaxID=1494606 RepID=UPI00195F70E0|nr:MalY/PatB family protein [Sporohalobacter salinus]MBM7624882.1 cystathionine beta-lyase [Sporohalobacter salinus]